MRQRLGQHFLKDPNVIKTIVAGAELKPTDTALEIGPGRGILTEAIVPRVKQLTAVEIDEELVRRLNGRKFATIVQGDILKTDLDALFPRELWPIKVLGNLPYVITSPIFEKILAWPGWDIGVFLVQKEVAERIQASAGTRAFGILTLAVQLYANAEILLRVGPEAFNPPPNVDSAVLRLRRKSSITLSSEAISAYFDLAHGAFAHRRKTLANSLALFTEVSRATVEKWLLSQGIAEGVRAEELGCQDYARLAEPWSIFRREINLTVSEPTSRIPRASNKKPSDFFQE